MRILVTCFTYAPQKNGVQFVTQYLCEGLVRRGHEVTVLTHLHEGLPEKEAVSGVTVERWPICTRHTIHRGPRRQFVERVVSRQDEFDVLLNVCTQSPMTDWLLPHLGELSTPKVLQIHSVWDFVVHPWDRATLGTLVRKCWANARWGFYYRAHGDDFRSYDRVLQLYEQDYSVRYFERWYGIESEILENAAEDVFHEGAPALESRRERTVVCVANYTRQKNQGALVEAFLRSNVPDDWRLVLVGSTETPQLAAIRQQEASLRAELGLVSSVRGVEFRTGVPREETVRLVKTASIYAMSSQREAFPVSLVEAMSAGVPWVSTDVGIARWLPGGVVASVEGGGFKAALERLAGDGAERARLGSQGFDYAAEHFRIDDKVAQMERVLLEVAGGSQ